jgi:Ca-activated chloride channel homolog
MARRALIPLAVLVVALVSAPVAAVDDTPRSPSTFRSGVDVVALNVTVTDQQARLLGGLPRDSFQVFEDGVRQDIAYFETSEVPLDLAVLIDTSISMQPRLPFVQRAASGLTETLRPADRAAIVGFSSRVQMLQTFTADRDAIRQAIAATTAGGGTALYNALYVTLREFQRVRQSDGTVRRRAIVVLSDGEDTASLLSFEELMAEARRAGVTIYTIGLHAEPEVTYATQRARRYFSQADFSLRSLAQETGAAAFFPTCADDLSAAYAAIGRELAHQYAIGYVSRNPMKDGAFRRVVVRVADRPEARPRTRTGYLAAN